MSGKQTFTAQDLQEAYEEGFQEGVDYNNLEYKYPPLSVAWINSSVRSKISQSVSQEELDHAVKWMQANYNERTNWPLREAEVIK